MEVDADALMGIDADASVGDDADSSMRAVVNPQGKPWAASSGDSSRELGGVSGTLPVTREEIDMGSGRVVVGLANCACPACGDAVGGTVGDHEGVARREGRKDMFGEDGWRYIL